MSAQLPFGHTATMSSRQATDPGELDYFPTPPWATRAFLPVLRQVDPKLTARTVWEPCCGEGHMASVLAEGFARVVASDVHDYGYRPIGPGVLSAARPSWSGVGDFATWKSTKRLPFRPDWIVTNPPFNRAVEFAEIALDHAEVGVAFLVRTQWLEGGDRYTRLFSRRRPRLVAQYSERVAMTKGRWDPNASTAAAYCWVIWTRAPTTGRTEFTWIPPGQRAALTRREDIAQFAMETPAPLLDGGGE